jgi:hypothetical protein
VVDLVDFEQDLFDDVVADDLKVGLEGGGREGRGERREARRERGERERERRGGGVAPLASVPGKGQGEREGGTGDMPSCLSLFSLSLTLSIRWAMFSLDPVKKLSRQMTWGRRARGEWSGG